MRTLHVPSGRAILGSGPTLPAQALWMLDDVQICCADIIELAQSLCHDVQVNPDLAGQFCGVLGEGPDETGLLAKLQGLKALTEAPAVRGLAVVRGIGRKGGDRP